MLQIKLCSPEWMLSQWASAFNSKSNETSCQQQEKSWRYMFSPCGIPLWWTIHQSLVTVLSIISPKTWYTWENLQKKNSSFYTIKVISQNTFSLNLSQLLLWSVAWREGFNKLGQTILVYKGQCHHLESYPRDHWELLWFVAHCC